MSDTGLMNDALAREHAAVYGFAVVAARFERLRERAEETLAAHEDRIERLRELIEALGADPVVSRPAYPVPPLNERAEAERLAERLERACLAAYVAMIAGGTAAHRDVAAEAMTETAEILMRWGAAAEPFPGLSAR